MCLQFWDRSRKLTSQHKTAVNAVHVVSVLEFVWRVAILSHSFYYYSKRKKPLLKTNIKGKINIFVHLFFRKVYVCLQNPPNGTMCVRLILRDRADNWQVCLHTPGE